MAEHRKILRDFWATITDRYSSLLGVAESNRRTFKLHNLRYILESMKQSERTIAHSGTRGRAGKVRRVFATRARARGPVKFSLGILR